MKMNGERYIGVALDYSPSSKYALKWTLDNILRPNDHLIVVVVNKEMLLEGGSGVLWEKTGTRKFFAVGLLEIHRLWQVIPLLVQPPLASYRLILRFTGFVSDL